MARHLSRDIRERVEVVWYFQQQKSVLEIAQLAGCSKHTVYTILGLHRDFGEVRNPFARIRGCRRTLDLQDVTYITSTLKANPTLYLDEVQERLFSVRGTVGPGVTWIIRVMLPHARAYDVVSPLAIRRLNEQL